MTLRRIYEIAELETGREALTPEQNERMHIVDIISDVTFDCCAKIEDNEGAFDHALNECENIDFEGKSDEYIKFTVIDLIEDFYVKPEDPEEEARAWKAECDFRESLESQFYPHF